MRTTVPLHSLTHCTPLRGVPWELREEVVWALRCPPVGFGKNLVTCHKDEPDAQRFGGPVTLPPSEESSPGGLATRSKPVVGKEGQSDVPAVAAEE